METRKFTIECEVPERWVNDFCAMLETMQHFGEQGHSEIVGIYADGDGDFRPTFDIKTDFDITKAIKATQLNIFKPMSIYDAG